MSGNKIQCGDSGLLWQLLEEASSDGELETPRETSIANETTPMDITDTNSLSQSTSREASAELTVRETCLLTPYVPPWNPYSSIYEGPSTSTDVRLPFNKPFAIVAPRTVISRNNQLPLSPDSPPPETSIPLDAHTATMSPNNELEFSPESPPDENDRPFSPIPRTSLISPNNHLQFFTESPPYETNIPVDPRLSRAVVTSNNQIAYPVNSSPRETNSPSYPILARTVMSPDNQLSYSPESPPRESMIWPIPRTPGANWSPYNQPTYPPETPPKENTIPSTPIPMMTVMFPGNQELMYSESPAHDRNLPLSPVPSSNVTFPNVQEPSASSLSETRRTARHARKRRVISEFTAITSEKQKRCYKKMYEKYFAEYQRLHDFLYTDYESNNRSGQEWNENSDAENYRPIMPGSTMAVEEQISDEETYNRYHFLWEKLKEIKTLIKEYRENKLRQRRYSDK